MANIPVNAAGTLLSGSASLTGSYAGFSVLTAPATFTGLKDANGTELTGGSRTLVVTNTTTIPIFVTSASISAGSVLFYV